MKNLWLKLGCFLTGYNYFIIKNSSEASAKAVKKYLSAMLIVSTLWGFIGFAFTQRYLHGSTYAAIFGALLMIFIVIQIERQIILSIGKNHWAFGFRVAIGLVMAIIGSLILDQIIFKDDIEKKKIDNVVLEVNHLLPLKTQELNSQIQQVQNAIVAKEKEREGIINEITLKPKIQTVQKTTISERDTVSGKLIPKNQTTNTAEIDNPKAALIPQIDEQIKHLNEQKIDKENKILNIQQDLYNELNSKIGFLEELNVMFSILLSSMVALSVWTLLFFFFLAIELFVMVNKFGDSKDDYWKIIAHQRDIRIKMIDKLAEDNHDKKVVPQT